MSRFRVGMEVAAPMSGAERVIARIMAITKKGTIRADIGGKAVEFTDIDALEVIDRSTEAA
jgi:hypothetical protein